MALFIFGRFKSIAGKEYDFAEALREVMAETQKEAGNIAVQICRLHDDPGEFRVFSHWASEQAFDAHSTLPHVTLFSERVAPWTADAGLVKADSVAA